MEASNGCLLIGMPEHHGASGEREMYDRMDLGKTE